MSDQVLQTRSSIFKHRAVVVKLQIVEAFMSVHERHF